MTTAERVNKHRAALRKAGLRPIQIWAPHTRRKSFAEEARRQSRLVAQDPKEARELELWTEMVSCEGWR